MASINALSVTLAQAAHLIATNGATNTFVLLGQPGVGKSAILSILGAQMPDYTTCYIDAANLDLGDLGMPMVDRDRGVTEYAPNVRFGIRKDTTKPVIIMIDEVGKAARPVMNMLLPLLNEKRIGDVYAPPGSIVFATSNLITDGVGDNFPAHFCNRITTLDVRNPTFDEWAGWAYGAGIAPEILAFVNDTPIVFQRYDTLGTNEKNPYIFNPRTGSVRAFCSPRSLERASHLVANRAVLGDAFLPALAGTIGEPAARQLEALTMLSDKLPDYASVVKAPAKTALPGDVGAYFLMAFKMAQMVEEKQLVAVMSYVDRWTSLEAKALFVQSLSANRAKLAWLVTHKPFLKLCTEFGKYFA